MPDKWAKSTRMTCPTHKVRGTLFAAYPRRWASMNRSAGELLVVVLALLGMSGCYPILRTEQPKFHLRVRDESGHPVKDASVMFATYRYPFPSSETTTLVTHHTDAAGVVSLFRKSRWQMQILLPDGSAWYTWRFCIEKAGYRAFASAEAEDFEGPVEVVLKESVVASGCEWPGKNQAYYDLKVVE